MAAVVLFERVRCKLQSMKLPRRAAEVAAQASACELAMGRFQECVQLCRAALEVRPPLPCQSVVKERMRNALLGIKSGPAAVDSVDETPGVGEQHHHGGLDVMSSAPIIRIATFDSDDRRVEEEQHTLHPVPAESLPSEVVDDQFPSGPLLSQEAPCAPTTIGSTCSLEEQLASALARCRELEQRCGSLTLERDEAASACMHHQERAAELELQFQELQASHKANKKRAQKHAEFARLNKRELKEKALSMKIGAPEVEVAMEEDDAKEALIQLILDGIETMEQDKAGVGHDA